MAKTLPPPPPPPPVKKKTVSLTPTSAFNNFINAHPSMRGYADTIQKYAKEYGMDKTVMAALFWRESFSAAGNSKDPASIVSPAGAVGIGQIMPLHVGSRTPWGAVVTQSDLVNPDFNIRWSTWYFSQQVQKYGTPDAAYSQGYNPGYTGPALSTLLPAKYVPQSGLSPTEAASASVQAAAAKKTLTDPYVVLTKAGTFKYVNAPTPPKGTITDGAGDPITKTLFVQDWQQYYSDTYAAYTGKHASPAEIAKILKSGITTTGLANQLAKQPGFAGSPVYKMHGPGLRGIADQILGANAKLPAGLIATAISQNWDQATFEQHLRTLPEYRQGPEFQTNLSQNEAAFTQIYGAADPAVKADLANKTAAGWTPDELQTWLRQQDSYKFTPEYQSKMLSVMGPQGLGLITGQQATLSTQQVSDMLNAQAKLKTGTGPNSTASQTFPDQSTGALARAGVGVGGAGA